MVGYNITENVKGGRDQGGQRGLRREQGGQPLPKSQPLSWGHLPNGGTVANLGISFYYLFTIYLILLGHFSQRNGITY